MTDRAKPSGPLWGHQEDEGGRGGAVMDNHDPELRKMGEAFEEVSRQLAAANERAGRLEAQMVELQKAWDILRHDDFVVNGGGRVNWNAHDEAKANIDRILGGA